MRSLSIPESAGAIDGAPEGGRGDRVKVRSGVIANPGTEHVFDGLTEAGERSDARGVQRPVQIHLLAEGEIESARLQAAWQKIVERLATANEASEQVNGNGNGNGAVHHERNGSAGKPARQNGAGSPVVSEQ